MKGALIIPMTGRDLIIHILQNGLENEPVFKDGRLLGFMTAIEAAVTFDTGLATIQIWFERGLLDGIIIGNELYIPANAKYPGTENKFERHERNDNV